MEWPAPATIRLTPRVESAASASWVRYQLAVRVGYWAIASARRAGQRHPLARGQHDQRHGAVIAARIDHRARGRAAPIIVEQRKRGGEAGRIGVEAGERLLQGLGPGRRIVETAIGMRAPRAACRRCIAASRPPAPLPLAGNKRHGRGRLAGEALLVRDRRIDQHHAGDVAGTAVGEPSCSRSRRPSGRPGHRAPRSRPFRAGA